MSVTDNDDWDKSVYAQDYVVVVYGYITMVVMIVITCSFAVALHKHKKSNDAQDPQQMQQDTKAVTKASIVVIILYLFAAIALPPVFTQWIVVHQEHGHALYTRLILIGGVPYAINNFVLLCFILLRRLKTSIIGMRTERDMIRARIHRLSYVIPSSIVICACVPITIISAAIPSQTAIVSAIARIISIIVFIIYIIIAAIYLTQISKIMRQKIMPNISLAQIEIDRPKVMEAASNENKSASNTNVEIIVNLETIHDAVRSAFLVTFVVASNFLLPIFGAIGSTQTKHESHANTMIFLAMFTDIMCNTLCICLLFKFTEIWYFRLCGKCHQCVLDCCIKKVGKEFVKKNPNHSYEDYAELILNK